VPSGPTDVERHDPALKIKAQHEVEQALGLLGWGGQELGCCVADHGFHRR
jgi:hypothetical protein